MRLLFFIFILGASSSAFAQEKNSEKKNKIITYQYEKDIDKSLENYSKIVPKDLTPLKKKYIMDLVKKNFAEQKAIRQEQRKTYLDFWNKAPAILQKEWAIYENEVIKLESQITSDNIKKNTEIFRKINAARIKSVEAIRDKVFAQLNHINEVTGRLQLERNVQLKEKLLRTLSEEDKK